MTSQGPPPFGLGPEDAGGLEHHGEDAHDADADDGHLRGWVAPEDRLWRHPSELFGTLERHPAQLGAGGWPAGEVAASWAGRRRMAAGFVATSAAAAVVMGVVLMTAVGIDRGTGPGRATGSTATSVTAAYTRGVASGAMPGAAASVARAMVTLLLTTPSGRQRVCAVAVAEGGLVATAAEPLLHATAVSVVLSPDRVRRASLLGVDPDSDVALVRVPRDLPVPQFDGSDDPGAGHSAVVLTAAGGGPGRSSAWTWSSGTIVGAGGPVGTEPAALAGITAASRAPAVPGGILVEPNGDVAGLLDHAVVAPDGEAVGVFVPGWLVLGVSSELAASGTVHHGWLDVTVGDVPGELGAVVTSVDPDGPSGQALRAGDVIVGLGSAPVRSTAELRERLYLLGPGTPVRLRILRNGTASTVIVDLGEAAQAPGGP
ncbi:MAG TPA: PDZ domain-containing protein [Acidimicrobiales bacterium]|nr:PDZ domain-containing protein [Acidimicrobiales bacterium]HLH47537.1 PDZ domain-containing protein [Acidimicrobiales bacterium]